MRLYLYCLLALAQPQADYVTSKHSDMPAMIMSYVMMRQNVGTPPDLNPVPFFC